MCRLGDRNVPSEIEFRVHTFCVSRLQMVGRVGILATQPSMIVQRRKADQQPLAGMMKAFVKFVVAGILELMTYTDTGPPAEKHRHHRGNRTRWGARSRSLPCLYHRPTTLLETLEQLSALGSEITSITGTKAARTTSVSRANPDYFPEPGEPSTWFKLPRISNKPCLPSYQEVHMMSPPKTTQEAETIYAQRLKDHEYLLQQLINNSGMMQRL